MKRVLRIFVLILGILAVIVMLWIALVVYAYSGIHPYTPEPVYSADKLRVIIPIINYDKKDYRAYLQVHLKVQEVRSRRVLFEVQTDASDRMKWSVEWIGDKTVKLDSTDIGSYCWKEGADETWSESECP